MIDIQNTHHTDFWPCPVLNINRKANRRQLRKVDTEFFFNKVGTLNSQL